MAPATAIRPMSATAHTTLRTRSGSESHHAPRRQPASQTRSPITPPASDVAPARSRATAAPAPRRAP
uniref:Uncharacterized protein n=1 Tax=Siphoviridae sp. ctPrm3 TaxID=2827864 RepID=A0A8S5TPD9_9CAUD|nr:MAG TPA: hypothetical protein [Siphoviridae sp. ctPrm3]